MSWADRILALVQVGDFLQAIELTRSYYTGEAPGNRIGLPADQSAMQQLVGSKLRELMLASANYAFSEDRLTDQTHVTDDGRGVDRTSLFENIVGTCARACVALDDFDFLYEDLYERYHSWGISSIFLRQLEPFVLDSTINYVPPRITQRIIASHAEKGNLEDAERLIWHIDPQCLDIDQAIHLCREHNMWDALIYVFCAALHDYVSPIVELLALIRRLQRYRLRSTTQNGDGTDMEALIPQAYKLFQYLADVLSGLMFPSQTPIQPQAATAAKKEIYTFLFFGRSSVWPKGEGGKLVLTTIEEDGVEPTYPYLRLLLRFDAEAFLHTLDVAFEDSFLNDRSSNVSRLVIVKILLELQSSTDLSPADITFINIFIARNRPKYPQYLDLISTSALQNVLIGLASDPDQSTQEDRQLAAEYILSVYTPHHTDYIISLFHDAKFHRILRRWFRQDQQWNQLLKTYIDDPNIEATELFGAAADVFASAEREKQPAIRKQLNAVFVESLNQLLGSSIMDTASLVDRFVPEEHVKALGLLGSDSPHKQFAYLRALMEPGLACEEQSMPLQAPSKNIRQPEKE